MTQKDKERLADIMSDINDRFPGPAAVTIKQIGEYLGVSRPTATSIMYEIGIQTGTTWRAPKYNLCRFVAFGQK